jgi:hypothetical protein
MNRRQLKQADQARSLLASTLNGRLHVKYIPITNRDVGELTSRIDLVDQLPIVADWDEAKIKRAQDFYATVLYLYFINI